MTVEDVLKNNDCMTFERAANRFIEEQEADLLTPWRLFCDDLKQLPSYAQNTLNNTEKLWLMTVAFRCLLNQSEETAHLAQLSRLALYLKSVHGLRLLHLLFATKLEAPEYLSQTYASVCQLLLDLGDSPEILREVTRLMPNLTEVGLYLKAKHEAYIQTKYPVRNIDEVIDRFQKPDSLVKFPLQSAELEALKVDYLAIQQELSALRTLSSDAIQTQFSTLKSLARQNKTPELKQQLFAIIVEIIRRDYKIAVHDTQLLSCLALLVDKEGLKGRIGQIKTGEGKSTIIAMLAAYLGCMGEFVDVITSSDYLAIRDCKKYRPFYESLGLTVSHICELIRQPEHFIGQILYGTSKDFEFAQLDDGLYNEGLRKSIRDGILQEREFGVTINDEIDSLFLDMALNAALLSIKNDKDYSWVYPVIFDYARKEEQDIPKLRQQLMTLQDGQYADEIRALKDGHLKNWLRSAYIAIHGKQIKQDYIVKPVRELTEKGYQYIDKIVPIDAQNTGRQNEGCQWHHGLTQFLQIKEQIPLTQESLTAASLAHPTYFGQYKTILGLTGTMGEQVERDEIQKIYHVDSFDVPSYLPNIRERQQDLLTNSKEVHHEAIENTVLAMQRAGRPTLVLFETIKESDDFHEYLTKKGVKNQLINTTQRESEDYLIARAGEPGMVTIATNAAGRGTDVLLAPDSKRAGGLHVIFAFYPDNVRVEEQGFGRASRQGQPGSCNMILSLQEKRIQQLLQKELQSPDVRYKLLILTTAAKLLGEKIVVDEGFIDCLNQLRKEKIQTESETRLRSSQQEAIFFEKMQHFFNQLAIVQTLLKQEDFKQQCITLCKNRQSETARESTPFPLAKEWTPIIQFASNLLTTQQRGFVVDWRIFFTQFQALYLQSARKAWANFYNKLHDEIGYGETEIIKSQVDEAYAMAKNAMDQFLENPAQKIQDLLEFILIEATKEMVLHTQQTALSEKSEVASSVIALTSPGQTGFFAALALAQTLPIPLTQTIPPQSEPVESQNLL